MRSWSYLFKKEIKSLLFFLMVVTLLIVGWQLFLFYKVSTTWPAELGLGLSTIPYSIFPLLMLWQGYQSFRQEWKDQTIYYLLSLPRAGWQLTLAKTTAAFSIFTIITIINTVIIYIFNKERVSFLAGEAGIPFNVILNIGLKILILYLFYGLVAYLISQWSYLFSRFYEKFNGLVSIVVFVLSGYLIFRGGSLLAPLLNWLPDIPVQIVNIQYGMVNKQLIYIGSGPLIGSLIILISLYWLGSWVLENHLEV